MGDPNKRQSLDTPGSALKILVANKAAGTVIGKGGATINSIKETTGVRIKVSGSTDTFPGTQDRVVLLSGTVEAVMAASRMVIEQIVKEPDPNGTAEASAGTGEVGAPQHAPHPHLTACSRLRQKRPSLPGPRLPCAPAVACPRRICIGNPAS